MPTLDVNKKLVQLTPKQFEKWFDKRFSSFGTWKKYYKTIGGKVPRPVVKESIAKSEEKKVD